MAPPAHRPVLLRTLLRALPCLVGVNEPIGLEDLCQGGAIWEVASWRAGDVGHGFLTKKLVSNLECWMQFLDSPFSFQSPRGMLRVGHASTPAAGWAGFLGPCLLRNPEKSWYPL